MKANTKKTFTLIELLVVISIIAVLSTLIMPVVSSIRNKAKRTQCSSNLRELYLAVQLYAARNDDVLPSWLSNLYPDLISEKSMFVCPADSTSTDGDLRSINRPVDSADFDQARSTFDRPGTSTVSGYSKPNKDVPKVSYIYEFCGGKWPDGWSERNSSGESVNSEDGSWQSLKNLVLKQSPSYQSKMPMIRCFWHADKSTLEPVLNVASDRNIFLSRSDWKDNL